MKDDTIEGAELGITLAPVLGSLTRSGAIDAAALPSRAPCSKRSCMTSRSTSPGTSYMPSRRRFAS